MCLPPIRFQLFTLTPIFFYYITHVHLLQFFPPSTPDILCPPPPSFARFCDTRISSNISNVGYSVVAMSRGPERGRFWFVMAPVKE